VLFTGALCTMYLDGVSVNGGCDRRGGVIRGLDGVSMRRTSKRHELWG
jgi:hypothetical protein